jgi:hypothetical protein
MLLTLQLNLASGAAISGSMGAVETGVDAFAASGTVLVAGSAGATEAGDDVSAIAGTVLVAGSVGALETGADAFSGSGTVAWPAISGSMAITEAGIDSFSGVGNVIVTVASRVAAMKALNQSLIGSTDKTKFRRYGLGNMQKLMLWR